MDLNSLSNQVSNLSLYDLKAGFRKAQNAVMNYTEMEAKVREATNNEPWGCPTSVMQEIANGTFNYSTLNEIMPMIYKRFTEKAAEEWRQIYKALQLLEFLIKNGSERVVDDARSHMSLLKMLRQFHYIDQNGKDQGINVRNRAKELAELLSDVERIRAERKKARATRNKYGGVEGGVGMGGSSSSRYGGFGNESGSATYGGYSGGVYGDGGGFGGASDDFAESQGRRTRFEEYNEYDEGTSPSSSRRRPDTGKRVSSRPEPAKPKEPEVDLFDFSADDISSPPAISNGNQASAADDFGAMQSGGAADDDFDDFQSATPAGISQPATIPPPASSNNQFSAPQGQAANFNFASNTISPPPNTSTPLGSNYSAFKAPPPAPAQQQTPNYMQPQQPTQQPPKPAGYQAATPNYFGSIPVGNAAGSAAGTPGGVTSPGAAKPASKGASKSGDDPFASLAIGGTKKTAAPTKGPTMADLSRQKASAGIWGTSATAPAQPQQQQQQGGSGGTGNDLLGL